MSKYLLLLVVSLLHKKLFTMRRQSIVCVKNTEISRNSGAKWSAGTSECDRVMSECDGRGLNLCVVPSL